MQPISQLNSSPKINLSSSVFKEGEYIPKKYSGQGEDINPPLSWDIIPVGTKSFALIIDDPDAQIGNWTHWLVKNIPNTQTYITENSIPGQQVPNSWGKKNYGGPMPPKGIHRYFFKLYALDIENMKADNTEEFYKEVEKHKIEMGVLMGKYKKF